MKKVVLINDTSLFNAHFGCQLVGQSFRENFARSHLELIGALPLKFDAGACRALLKKADLLVINGEGSIHHGKNLHLLDLAAHYPVALVNCVYQENPPSELLSRCRFIAARESKSAAELRRQGAEARVVPDVIFDSLLLNAFQRGAPSEDIGITDGVTDTTAGFGPKTPLVADYLSQLCRHRRIVTGRYHAAVACMVMGIPFCAWPSNTWKIEGMLADAGAGELLAADQASAIQCCPTDHAPKLTAYAGEARRKIRAMFDVLAGI
ncbi:MAG: Polysaccharide pyruvyl transferase [Rariglobus sp.]|nr:Polysaccharide pyruvyl transferase [Rariglobus sp.]